MSIRGFTTVYRIGFSALVLVAIIVQLVYGLRNPGFSAVNFFSFFTILSNLYAAIVLIGFGRKDYLRGAAVLYMVATGIIYVLLLSKADVQTPLPWVNITLHYVFPVVLLADWLLVPPGRRLSYKRSMWWLVFPFAYFAYSLLRGPLAHWYPYPFMDVVRLGYTTVLINALFVALAFILLTAILTLIARSRAKPS